MTSRISQSSGPSTIASSSSIPSAAALASLANSIVKNATLNNQIAATTNSPGNQLSNTPGVASTNSVINSNDLINKMSNVKPLAQQQQQIVRVSLDVQLFKPEKLYPTPSMSDNLPFDIEFDLRLTGCELIQTAGRLLKLPQTAMATAQVLFHRFFYIKSFVKNPMEYYAMASIFLSSKIEECPRRIRDVMNVFHHIKQVRNAKVIKPMQIDEMYSEIKNQVIKAERRILKELGFCVHVKHPHKIIFIYLKAMECSELNLSQKAWNYMNDSFRTDIFLRYSPENIVCACIYLSANESQISLPQNPPWFTIFGASEEIIKEICVRILHLYSHQTKSQEELEKIINECRDQLTEEKRRARESNVVNLTIESSNEPAKNDNSKPVNDSIKHNTDVGVVVSNSHTTSLKTQSRPHSSISPNSVDPMNVLNPYYNSVGMPTHPHHHPHISHPHHIPPQGYPIAHSSHQHQQPMLRHPNYGAYPNYYHDPHYMNGNEQYYHENYHNENFYETGSLKRNKSSSYYKASSQYKETEEYVYSKKQHSSNSRSDEKQHSGKERSKISNTTNKYDYQKSKSRSRSKSPWKKVRDEKSRTNRNSRKRTKSRSVSSNESETHNDHEARSPTLNSKHKKKKSSHHSHRKEETTHRNRHRENEREQRSRSKSNSRSHQKSSTTKTKTRSKDRETRNNSESSSSRYIPILS